MKTEHSERKWRLMDMLTDRRTGKMSAEKFWYNVKSAASTWCLVWYVMHGTPPGSAGLEPLVILIFLFLNEGSAVSFIALAARRYGIDLGGDKIRGQFGGGMGGIPMDGDEVGAGVGYPVSNYRNDGVGNPSLGRGASGGESEREP